MNRVLAAMLAALVIPAAGQGVGGVILTNSEFNGEFANRGQYVSAVAKCRDTKRQRGIARRSLSLVVSLGLQQASLRTTRCRKIEGY